MEARKLQISLQCAVVYGSSAAALSTYPSHYYIPSLRLCCTWPPTSEGFLCKACRFLTLCPAAAEVLCFSESTRLVILSTHRSPATPLVSVPSWGEEGGSEHFWWPFALASHAPSSSSQHQKELSPS